MTEQRALAAEEEFMDIDSVLKGMSNGSITTSIGMDMEQILEKFPAFGDLPLKKISAMVSKDIDFIWEWTDAAGPDGKFSSWKEMYVKDNGREKVRKRLIEEESRNASKPKQVRRVIRRRRTEKPAVPAPELRDMGPIEV